MGTAQQVRLATLADLSAVARLSSEWGYPTSEDLTRPRLERLLASSSHLVLVAEVDGTPAGWGTAEIRLSLGSDPRVEITGLVVGASFRRAGIGRSLVTRLESWALEKGCHELFLRSNVARSEAHPFYECLGYERSKTQHAYKKVLHAA
jgi:GNAT superfamily N-acetyltransferase